MNTPSQSCNILRDRRHRREPLKCVDSSCFSYDINLCESELPPSPVRMSSSRSSFTGCDFATVIYSRLDWSQLWNPSQENSQRLELLHLLLSVVRCLKQFVLILCYSPHTLRLKTYLLPSHRKKVVHNYTIFWYMISNTIVSKSIPTPLTQNRSELACLCNAKVVATQS